MPDEFRRSVKIAALLLAKAGMPSHFPQHYLYGKCHRKSFLPQTFDLDQIVLSNKNIK